MNRDNEESERDKSKTWTFLESLYDAYSNNRSVFLLGFFSAVIVCTLALICDPYDRSGINEYVRSLDEHEDRVMDTPLGYQNRIKREKEQNPELFDA